MKSHEVLGQLAWGEKHFGSLTTGRALSRRDMMREVGAGNAKSIGYAALCDGDGFTIQPERYRECFVMTPRGRALFDAEEARREKDFEATWEGQS